MSLLVDIRKDYGDFLLDTRFETENGITGILGASGCGKSLTLKCIAGIENPDEGRIVLNGRVLFDSEKGINLKPQERKVAYLFQNYALFPNMTVKENILCGLHNEKNRKKKEDSCRRMMDTMQLSGLEDRYPSQISGGQQQRTALARILVNAPEAILLDEPFSALDAHLREKTLLETRTLLNKFGGVSIAVTHNRDEAYSLCSSIALMHAGKVFAHGPTKEVFAHPETAMGAFMTGCKNIAEAFCVDAHTVEVPEWNVCYETKEEVPEDMKYVGVRAHYFNVNCMKNHYPVFVEEVVEEPFAQIVRFRYLGQKPDTEALWWRLGKEVHVDKGKTELGIAPGNIQILREDGKSDAE